MVKIVDWNGNKLHCIEWKVNGEIEWCFFGKEVVQVLGYDVSKNSYTKYVKRFCDQDETIKVKFKELQDYPNKSSFNLLEISRKGEILVTKQGVIKLVNYSQILSKEEKIELLLKMEVSKDMIVVRSRKEIDFINKLEECLKISFSLGSEDELSKHFLGIKQYKVLDYKIDYYIPCIKLAIEYDEDNHNGYTYEQQELRQKRIEKELGCRFMRVDDKNDEINLALVFARVMSELEREYYYKEIYNI